MQREFVRKPSLSLLSLVLLGAAAGHASAAEAASGARQSVSQGETFRGEFAIRIASNFDGTSTMTYHLDSDTETITLSKAWVEANALERGAEYSVEGRRVDGTFFVDAWKLERAAVLPVIDPEKRDPRRIGLISVYWDTAPSNKEQLKLKTFTGNKSTNLFYQENSYGMEKLVGNVFGPFLIPEPTGCNYMTMATNARAAMDEAGYNTGEFDQFMYYFPRRSDCGWAGLASVGSPTNSARDSWYNGASGCTVLAQEIGHNYGMIHSHTYEGCTVDGQPAPYGADCSPVEYGHPYDPMGSGCGHMNVVQKSFMGWLDGCNIVSASADGTFNLLPTELPCNGTQALRIEVAPEEFYYLEYRQPNGEFDTTFEGVLVHVGDNHEGFGGPDSYLLDVNGDDAGYFMRAGASYTDYLDRLTITVLEENTTHAVVQLEFPDGGSGTPSCIDGSTPATELGNVGALECADAPPPHDIIPPTVSITYPADGEVFEPGADFTITAEAVDENGVAHVELYIGSEAQYKDLSAPYEFSVVNIPAGVHKFGVVASDGVNQTASQQVTVYVGMDGPGTSSSDGGSDTSTGGGEDEGEDTGGGDDSDSDEPSADDEGTTRPGCGCTHGNSGGGGALALGLLALAGLRRRRRA